MKGTHYRLELPGRSRSLLWNSPVVVSRMYQRESKGTTSTSANLFQRVLSKVDLWTQGFARVDAPEIARCHMPNPIAMILSTDWELGTSNVRFQFSGRLRKVDGYHSRGSAGVKPEAASLALRLS
ncbi:hypothetical protein N7468_000475 [Penicillium chermesinum]|uniref:Uncharacterized protein n=1 Tax=Penicillium chermesinum TaxID=63820 RepID=A0A9W9PND4_9EURO|nr:uncharacterized protein N7468_000475 [Penicillium chermesinum]KAJ5249024.1 hypothetical protein N7468_000475 [Penicillium chermesinum]